MSEQLRQAGIWGTGSYAPPQVVTNDDLAQRLETSDEWIHSRTGIRMRRVAEPGTFTSDLAVAAAERALEAAGITAADLDLIIVATATPDYPGSFPSTAALVQARLGAKQAAAFDVGAVCAGFAYALHIGAQMVRTRAYNKVLIVGAETFSRILDWQDRATVVLFGDGAGAAVLGQVSEGCGYLGGILGADGSGASLLNVSKETGCIYQNGKEVYKFAITMMGEAAAQAVDSVGLQTSDVDLFIPHQANIRIIEKAAQRMGLSMSKVFVNLDRYGNTSAASIPLALDEAVHAGRIRDSSLVVLVGFGAGLTWGANVLRWGR